MQEVDALEMRLLQLRDTASEESALTVLNRKSAELQSARLVRRQEHERRRAAMVESITEAVARCANHREQVQKTLSSLKDTYSARLGVFLQSATPSAGGAVDVLAQNLLAAGPEQSSVVSIRALLHPEVASPSQATQRVQTRSASSTRPVQRTTFLSAASSSDLVERQQLSHHQLQQQAQAQGPDGSLHHLPPTSSASNKTQGVPPQPPVDGGLPPFPSMSMKRSSEVPPDHQSRVMSQHRIDEVHC